MVIGFNKQFVPLILNGTKIHTIRIDQHQRWKPGMTMHMATGVRTKHYVQFAKETCRSVQAITMGGVKLCDGSIRLVVWVDGKALTPVQVLEFTRNDGFDSIDQLREWFGIDVPSLYLHARLIH